MKRKRLALLLAAALTVTSVDGTAFAVSGADFSSEPVLDEAEAQPEEAAAEPAEENVEEESFADEASLTDETAEAETETESTEESQELAQPEEELTQEPVETVEPEEAEAEEELLFSAGDDADFEDEETSSIIPETVQELELDQSYDVDIEEADQWEWFSFTAAEDGNYSFSSEDSDDGDPIVYGYDTKAVGSEWDYTFSDDDGGIGCNFKLIFKAEKGKTYYFRVGQQGSQTGYFSVNMKKLVTPSSVQLNTENIVNPEIIAGLDYGQLYGLEVTLQYDNEKPSDTITFKNDYIIDDAYGNRISYRFESENGADIYNAGSTLNAGTYNIVILCNDEPVATESTYKVKAVEPGELQELHIGSDNAVKSNTIKYSWYKFVAPETATYVISPVETCNIFKETQEGPEYIEYDVSNSKCVVSFEKGTAYYIGLQGEIWSDDEDDYVNQWNLTVEERQEVSSVAFSEESMTYIKGLDNVNMYRQPGSLTVNYKNGQSEQVKVYLGQSAYDRYGNRITPKVTDSNGSEITEWYDDDGVAIELQEGSYKLTYICDKVTSAEIPFTVQKPDFNSYAKITEGENHIKVAVSGKSSPTWYAFEVEKTGRYQFKIQEQDGVDRDLNWKKLNENGDLEDYSPDWDDSYRKVEAGKYLISWEIWEEDANASEDATVLVKRVPEISSVKIKSYSPTDLTFIERVQRPWLDDLTAEVTYDDGTTRELDAENNDDEYGRWMSYDLFKAKDASGYYESVDDYENLPAGDYVFRVNFGGVYAEDIPVKVVSLDESVKQEVTTGTTEVKNQDKLVLKYKAPADGRYELETNVPISTIKFRTAKDRGPTDCVLENYRAYADFKKDTEYYLYVDADEYCPELKITVSSVTRPAEMETTALKKNYIAGVEYFKEENMQTTVGFGENKSRTVKGSDLVNGYYLHYQVKDSEGKEHSYYEPLTVGEWTVTPYLSASIQTGSAIAVEMSKLPVKSDTITAKKLEMDKLPSLEKDVWKQFENTGYSDRYYSFTAPEDGKYVFECSNEQERYNRGVGVFYSDGEKGYKDEGYSINLKKGETCLVVIYTSAECKLRVVNTAATETPEEVSSIALTDGLRKAITYTGKDIPCTFTPEEDGYYTMESESLDGSYLDTYVDLMCDGDKIGENDDDAGNGNFCLIKKLEKGKEYTYLPRTYNEDTGSFIISFHKTNIVPIKNIEIVPREGVDTSALTVMDDIRNYYNVKVTYENGTTAITGWWNQKDEYGNDIDKEVITPKQTGTEKELTYTVTVKYKNLGSDDEKEKKENITVKGIPSLEELKEANDYKITTFDRQYYRFTPSSEGQYIISLKQEDNDYNNVNVWTYGKLYDNQWETCIVEKAYEGENNYSVQLEAGREYLVSALGEVNNPEASFQIRKVKKTLKGLELVKAPEQAKCLPNDVNAVSYKGLQVKALYTDGSTETITYGNADSSGRYIYQGTVKWLDDGTGIAYANLGKYQVSFPLKADSWSNVPELKRDKATTVKAVRGDMVTLKFVPEKTDNYRFTVDGGYVVEEVVGENPDDSCNNPGNCNLKEGKIYYIHVHAYKENPSVTVVYADCIWDITSDTEATCTKEGKKVETCRKHGDTRVTVTPALGHKWNSGVITKKATCTADGVKTYTCSNCGEKKTEAIAKTGHKFSSWKKISDATVFAKQKQKRTCSVCKKPDYRYVGSKVKATIKLNLTSITLQQKQSTKAVKVTMAKGDSVKSWTSSNKKIATVDKKGTIKAVKKGTAKITVTLKSGKKATVTVKVQTSKVATSKITGLKSKVTVKKGKTLTLKPVLSPITSKDKITYKTSNKSVATVSSKGVITGKKKGTAKITVKAGKKSYVVTVTVK